MLPTHVTLRWVIGSKEPRAQKSRALYVPPRAGRGAGSRRQRRGGISECEPPAARGKGTKGFQGGVKTKPHATRLISRSSGVSSGGGPCRVRLQGPWGPCGHLLPDPTPPCMGPRFGFWLFSPPSRFFGPYKHWEINIRGHRTKAFPGASLLPHRIREERLSSENPLQPSPRTVLNAFLTYSEGPGDP